MKQPLGGTELVLQVGTHLRRNRNKPQHVPASFTRRGSYSEAIRLDPKYAVTFNNRGNSWSGKKNFDKAIGDYDKAISLNPISRLSFYNRGIAWHNTKEHEKAVKDYDEAIRLDATSADYHQRDLAYVRLKNTMQLSPISRKRWNSTSAQD